jgi:hypothetical protein
VEVKFIIKGIEGYQDSEIEEVSLRIESEYKGASDLELKEFIEKLQF